MRNPDSRLTDQERAICSTLGVSEQAYLAQRGKPLRLAITCVFGGLFDLGEASGESGRPLPQMREKYR
jgi:hypothetical protein